VLGRNRDVGFELEDPVAVLLLERLKASRVSRTVVSRIVASSRSRWGAMRPASSIVVSV
jgi:hypothetical protein